MILKNFKAKPLKFVSLIFFCISALPYAAASINEINYKDKLLIEKISTFDETANQKGFDAKSYKALLSYNVPKRYVYFSNFLGGLIFCEDAVLNKILNFKDSNMYFILLLHEGFSHILSGLFIELYVFFKSFAINFAAETYLFLVQNNYYYTNSKGTFFLGESIRKLKIINFMNKQKYYNITLANSFNLGEYSIENVFLSANSFYEPIQFLIDTNSTLLENKDSCFGSYDFSCQQINNSFNEIMIPFALLFNYESICKYYTLYNYYINGQRTSKVMYLWRQGDWHLTPWLGYKNCIFGFLYTLDLFVKYKSTAFKISVGGNKATAEPTNKKVLDFHQNNSYNLAGSYVDYSVYLGVTLGSYRLAYNVLVEAQLDMFFTAFNKGTKLLNTIESYLAFSYPVYNKINLKLALRYFYNLPLVNLKACDNRANLYHRDQGKIIIDLGLEFLV